MFCPQCGSTQNDELRFCKSCGANLQALRQILSTREGEEKFDWSKTWVAEMFMSGEEAVKRQAELERLQGITPEVKRRNEIKAGVITASIGLGLMILLFVLMGGIIAGGQVPPEAAAILSRLWIVGVIPVLVGAALVFNGMVVSKKGEQKPMLAPEVGNPELNVPASPEYLSPADTNELFPAGFSVTDETTKHLKQPR
jgi:hypothetical protein